MQFILKIFATCLFVVTIRYYFICIVLPYLSKLVFFTQFFLFFKILLQNFTKIKIEYIEYIWSNPKLKR